MENKIAEAPIEEEEEDTSFKSLPRGDIFSNYHADESPEKFDFLKARSIFRFPFTLTAMKWGGIMGSLFGLHNYFKKRKLMDALYWFATGTIMTGFPIWGFLMLKYSFYTLSIRKFERDQLEQAESSNLMKDYYTQKLRIEKDIAEDELLKKLESKQREIYQKYSQVDDIEEDPEIFAELKADLEKKKEEKEKK